MKKINYRIAYIKSLIYLHKNFDKDTLASFSNEFLTVQRKYLENNAEPDEKKQNKYMLSVIKKILKKLNVTLNDLEF